MSIKTHLGNWWLAVLMSRSLVVVGGRVLLFHAITFTVMCPLLQDCSEFPFSSAFLPLNNLSVQPLLFWATSQLFPLEI